MYRTRVILLLLWILGNANLALAQQIPPRMGLRFGYGLEFPSQNYVGAQTYYLVEAGHRLNYGASIDFQAAEKTQFTLYAGLEHQFWPKSLAYSADCTMDSFPTFMAVADTLPGRDHRIVSALFEPAFRFQLRPNGLYLRAMLSMAYSFQSKVEDYSHTCNAPLSRGWRDYEDSEQRTMQRFNAGLGFGLVKEVKVNERSGFLIEPGLRFMLTSLFRVEDINPDGPTFRLTPWGFYVNIGFFR